MKGRVDNLKVEMAIIGAVSSDRHRLFTLTDSFRESTTSFEKEIFTSYRFFINHADKLPFCAPSMATRSIMLGARRNSRLFRDSLYWSNSSCCLLEDVSSALGAGTELTCFPFLEGTTAAVPLGKRLSRVLTSELVTNRR